jgi:hypothetical protein
MSDGISDAYREQERYERWMNGREAACIVLNVVLSPPAERQSLAERYFRCGEPVPPKDVQRLIREAKRPWSGNFPPMSWKEACQALGVAEPPEPPGDGAEYGPAVSAAIRQLGILKPSRSPAEAFLHLEGGDAPVWARLLCSLDMDETNRPWRDRLQALSPFAESVVIAIEPRDGGRLVNYIIDLARAKGQCLEIHGQTRYGRETTLSVAVLPRVDSL